jgi:hypothetical protein
VCMKLKLIITFDAQNVPQFDNLMTKIFPHFSIFPSIAHS